MIDTYNNSHFNRNSPYFDQSLSDDDLIDLVKIIDWTAFKSISQDLDFLEENTSGHDSNVFIYNEELERYLDENNINYKIFKG